MKKYDVKVNLDLVVEAKDRAAAKTAVNDIPWEDVIDFEYPKAGFVREFLINGGKGKVVSARQRK